jgi:mono/diheme cytochrome c family protein
MTNRVRGVVAVLGALALGAAAHAQSSDAYFSKVKTPLSEAEARGHGMFLQRCSLCHLPQLPGRTPPVGPVLTGLYRSFTADSEARFRQRVLEGTPRMPAFKHTLQPQQVDDLVAYFKAVS